MLTRDVGFAGKNRRFGAAIWGYQAPAAAPAPALVTSALTIAQLAVKAAGVPTTVAAPVTKTYSIFDQSAEAKAWRAAQSTPVDTSGAPTARVYTYATGQQVSAWENGNYVSHAVTQTVTEPTLGWAGRSPTTGQWLPILSKYPAAPAGYPYPQDPTVPLDSVLPAVGSGQKGGLDGARWAWLAWQARLLWNTGKDPGSQPLLQGILSPKAWAFFKADWNAPTGLDKLTPIVGTAIMLGVAGIATAGVISAVAAGGAVTAAPAAGIETTTIPTGISAVPTATAAGLPAGIAAPAASAVAPAVTAPSLTSIGLGGAEAAGAAVVPTTTAATAATVGAGAGILPAGISTGTLATAGAGLAAKVGVPLALNAITGPASTAPGTPAVVPTQPIGVQPQNPLLASLGLGDVDPKILIGGGILLAVLLARG